MMDYCKVVSRTPPEGLWKWAVNADRRDADNTGGLDTFGLVYEKVFVPDTTLDGLIGDRVGKKIPVVQCTCSACGSVWDAGYAHAHAPDGATYGFLVEESGGMALAASGDSMICPCCGSPVSIRCKSKVGRDVYAGNAFVCSESYHMRAWAEAAGADRLVHETVLPEGRERPACDPPLRRLCIRRSGVREADGALQVLQRKRGLLHVV